MANDWLCSRGVSLHGAGFILNAAQAEFLGRARRPGLEKYIVPYQNGRDITARSRGAFVIDLFGLEEEQVRKRFPEVYQHLLRTVKSDRQAQYDRSPTKDAASYLEKWWIFGKPRSELRPALESLGRYIATVETTSKRTFQFLSEEVRPDNMIVCIALNDPYALGVLSSRIHTEWTYANCSLLGVAKFEQGHRYTKTKVFDPFPFPDATAEQRLRIGDLAEELDATRKHVLAEHGDLTLTGLYNLREKLTANTPFTMSEEDQRIRGRVDIMAELHDRIDAAVAEAYGWSAEWQSGTLADEEIVMRLLALNDQRAAEEKRGIVRWLRADYQRRKAGVVSIGKMEQAVQIEALLPEARAIRPGFPTEAIAQTAAVLADLRGGGMLTVEEIAQRYRKSKTSADRIYATLEALVRLGYVSGEAGRYRLRRAA